MKVLIYVRVSTAKQDNQRQIIQIENYCKSYGYEIVGRFEEKISGTIEVRDELTNLINEVKKAKVDYVIVSELSRLGRNVEVINTIKTIHKQKTGFISVKEGIKTDVKDIYGLQAADLLIGVLTSINTFELSTLKSRSISGLYKSVLNGGAVGSINQPYGYEKINKKLVKNEKEAQVIRDIFDLYMEGNGTTKISNILNSRSVPTRTELNIKSGAAKKIPNFKLSWVDGTIYSILKNPIYKGKRIFKGEEIEQESLKIIEPELFNEVNNRLKTNYNKADKHTNPNFNYIISKNKIFCGICDKTYFPHKRESGKDNRYICLSRRYKNNCGNYGISIDKIENLIQEVIFYIFTEKLVDVLDDKTLIKNINELEYNIKKINKEIEKLMTLENNVFEWQLKKKFSEELIDKKLLEINADRKSLKSKLIEYDIELIDYKRTQDKIKDIKLIKSNYKAGEKLPKQVIDKIITKIVITKQDEFPNIYNYKGDKVVEVKIITGTEELKFLLSQRTNIIFYLSKNGGFPLNKFFTGEYPKKAFDFMNGG